MNRPVTTVAATLTVRVPLHASGSLVDGAASVVDRIDAVDSTDAVTVRSISPGLNDTTVDCRVRITLARDDHDEALARRDLEAGVGVLAVDAVDSVEGDPPVVEAETERVRTG
ncbi:hypothetical protein CV102_16340 [Natronococcus pandeyae]|uniref:Uncharacterized protein n=1 Tax=Natronococcus pandeyae TaxID=2055836 RepID=A0A8J8TRG4_9EURY|nr:hypothetical protein [Natronococcus pandeyae]TYL37537.1 hypothetical protein CV102_16340 [Natronococcus pandeyae]